MFLSLLLLACAPTSESNPVAELAPPAPWYYADFDGGSIDLPSMHLVGREVAFRTVGSGLRSGALAEAAEAADALTCPGRETITRLVVTFEEGRLRDTLSVPRDPCVEGAAWARTADLASLIVDGGRVGDAAVAVLVLDIPADEGES